MNPLATLPPLLVETDGVRLAAEDAQALAEVRIQQRLSRPARCELTFLEPQGSVAQAIALAPGSALRILLPGETLPLFSGQVTALDHHYGPSGEHRIQIRAHDALYRLNNRQPVRAHVQLTLAELARQLVAELGLTVAEAEPGPLWQQLVQYRQTDLELLREVAERCGQYFILRGSVLQLLTLAGFGSPRPLTLGDSLLEARLSVDTNASCRTVRVYGWDPWLAEPRTGEAATPRTGRRVALNLESGQTDGERVLADAALQNDSQAQALAQAELDRRVAGEITLWGIAEGDPNLSPGTLVDIGHVAAPLGGRYVLTAVTHRLDHQRGFVSEFSTRPPTPGPRSQGALATLGRVTQVGDPEHLGRVRVALPGYNDIESDWLEVTLPGAGVDKGITALPDVGDHVLVLLAREDPAQALVLGGLYGARKPYDSGVEGEAVRRYTVRTPGGQKVRLDDKSKTVKIENSNGHFVTLSPGRVRLGNSEGSLLEMTSDKLLLHAKSGLEIEAPGQAIVIRGGTIDFERA